MIEAFIGRVYVFDDHFRIAFNYLRQGERREVDVPLENEGEGGEGENLSEGLFKLCTSPQHGLKQTPIKVYFIKGWFVADIPIAV